MAMRDVLDEKQTSGRRRVLGDIETERLLQLRRWGQQHHAPMVWLAILTEEVGEVAKEVAEARVGPMSTNYRNELIQVAAVAAAAVEAYDHMWRNFP